MNLNKVLFVALVSGTLQAQQVRTALWNTDQFTLRYWTMVEPPRPAGQEIHIGGGGADDGATNHRILTDSDTKKYFGYDLRVDRISQGHFQLTFKPLTVPEMARKWAIPSSDWTELQMPSVPAIMQVRSGEIVALDLLTNPARGEKIVEYLTVSDPDSQTAESRQPASGKLKEPANVQGARDLQIDDVHVMSLDSPALWINGRKIEWNRGDAHGHASGSVLWVYEPSHGRFLLSFKQNAVPGSRLAGTVNGSQIKFTWNNEAFEIRSTGAVLPASGNFNLYVSQDLSYKPAAYPSMLYGAADSNGRISGH